MNNSILQDMYYYHNKVGNIDLHTIGCELSEWDGERLAEGLYKKDCLMDKIIINTCAVTQSSQDASEMLAQRLMKIHNNKIIYITGCGVNYNPKFYNNLKGVYCFTNEEKFRKLSINDKLYKNFTHNWDKDEGYVKVQDGCSNKCTYCVVNKLRNKPYSLPIDDIRNQVETLLKQGKEHIELIGTEITQYNSDGLTIDTLCKLLLDEYPDIRKLTLNALNPASRKIEKIIDLIKTEPRMGNILYMSVQSGSDKILKLMDRKYDKQRILDINKKADGIEQVWDLVVGFPGETDEDFKETYNLVKEVNPVELMMCPFSNRIGSIASKLFSDNVSKKVVAKRIEELRNIIWNYEECEEQEIEERSKIVKIDLYDNDKVIELCKELEKTGEKINVETDYDITQKVNNKDFEVNAKLLSICYDVYFRFNFPKGEPEYINDFCEYMNGVKNE